ncbi:MAG: APC family permease [Alphaproteobacteria bacterium]
MTEISALKRTLGIPLLVFYGLGVTVGAGIFALIGDILRLAGDQAPLAFVIAGGIAGATALTYSVLARRYPRAAGEAIYARAGFGPLAGRLAGLGVVLTGIVSSGVIAIAFAGYVSSLTGLPTPLLTIAVLVGLGALACIGIRASITFAALITVLEIGTLVVIALGGLPLLADSELWARVLTLPVDRLAFDMTIAAAAIAFFAFIGFEDIVNMAEEARDPERILGPAIGLTLLITIILYVTITTIAVAVPDRAAITGSEAPLADLFAITTGLPAAPIAVMAALAMVNGILVQIVMVSRVLYGMANEGLIPRWFAAVAPRTRTPARATVFVTVMVGVLALTAPLLALAQLTGYITLTVFTLINLSLWRIAGRESWTGRKWYRWWGLFSGVLAAGLLAFEITRRL